MYIDNMNNPPVPNSMLIDLKKLIDDLTNKWLYQKDVQADFNIVNADTLSAEQIQSVSASLDTMSSDLANIKHINADTIAFPTFVRDIDVTSNVYATVASIPKGQTGFFSLKFTETTTAFGFYCSMMGSFNDQSVSVFNISQNYYTDATGLKRNPITGIGVADQGDHVLLFVTHSDLYGGSVYGGFINATIDLSGFQSGTITSYIDLTTINKGAIFDNVAISGLVLPDYQKKQYKDEILTNPYIINDDDRNNEWHYPTSKAVVDTVNAATLGMIAMVNNLKDYTDGQLSDLVDYVDEQDETILNLSKSYADGLVLGNQIWLSSVMLYADLPTSVPDDDKNYLCRVIGDQPSINGVYLAPAPQTDPVTWSFFSNNSEMLSQETIDDNLDLITVDHNDPIKTTLVSGLSTRDFETIIYKDTDPVVPDDNNKWILSTTGALKRITNTGDIIDIAGGGGGGTVQTVNDVLPVAGNVQIDEQKTSGQMSEMILNPDLATEGVTYYVPDSIPGLNSAYTVAVDWTTGNQITVFPWTCPQPGYVVLHLSSSSPTNGSVFTINGNQSGNLGSASLSLSQNLTVSSAPIFINQGDIISRNSGTVGNLSFYRPKVIPITVSVENQLDLSYYSIDQTTGLYKPKIYMPSSLSSQVYLNTGQTSTYITTQQGFYLVFISILNGVTVDGLYSTVSRNSVTKMTYSMVYGSPTQNIRLTVPEFYCNVGDTIRSTIQADVGESYKECRIYYSPGEWNPIT